MWNKLKKFFIKEVFIEKEVVKTEIVQKQIFVYTIPDSALATNRTYVVQSKDERLNVDNEKRFSLWMRNESASKYDYPIPSCTEISEDLFDKVEVGDKFKLLLVKENE